ncbi:MAG: TnsA endonuclease N-terminal domain-containing protein [Anaerolineae bacterium]|nr:TnsA endonuclease N-terminal domain-containing protein [Anaerolineae bacterium]
MSNKNSGIGIKGSFPSLKSENSVFYNSTIERDILYFFEFDEDVVWYKPQPFTIQSIFEDGSIHRYTPDYLVQRKNCRHIVECKPSNRLENIHTQRQLKIGTKWALENDHHMVVITDEYLRDGHILKNLKLLWSYSRLSIPHQVIEGVSQALLHNPSGLIISALSSLMCISHGGNPLNQLQYIYALLFRHHLVADLALPLTANTQVFLAIKE